MQKKKIYLNNGFICGCILLYLKVKRVLRYVCCIDLHGLKFCSIEMISVFHIFNTNILKCLKVSNVDGDYLLMMLYIRQLQMLNVRTVDILWVSISFNEKFIVDFMRVSRKNFIKYQMLCDKVYQQSELMSF